MAKLSDATRDKLKGVSTATITTALFKRGLRRQMIQDVHPLNPSLGNMVGEAFTLLMLLGMTLTVIGVAMVVRDRG